MGAYQYIHRVGFEETSLVGNVYYSNYLLWQGHCRERFLSDHARETLDLVMDKQVALFTRRCTCDYMGDWGFTALDEVVVKMELVMFRGGRMQLEFTYYNANAPDIIVAQGTQEVACKKRSGDEWVAAPFPASMVRALLEFAEAEDLRANLEDALAYQEG